MTDIHACRPWMPPERIRAIVERANALGGDIIVVLGDYIQASVRSSAGAASQPTNGAPLCPSSALRSACTQSWEITIGGPTWRA